MKEDTFVRSLLVFTVFVYTVCSGVLFFYHTQDGDFPKNLVITMPIISHFVVLISVFFWTHSCKSSLRHVVRQVFKYPGPDEGDQRGEYGGYLSEVKLTKILLFIVAFEMSGFVISGLSPFMTYVLVGKFDFRLTPQLAPWGVKTTFDKIFADSLRCPIFFLGFITHFLSQVCFTNVAIELLRQYKELKNAILTLNVRSSRRSDREGTSEDEVELSREEFDARFHFHVKKCIRHHKALIKLFEEFKIFYRIECSLQLSLMSSSFTFLFSGLVVKKDLMYYLQVIGTAWMMMYDFFAGCLFEELFTNMNSQIQNAVLNDLNWYDQSATNRKLMAYLYRNNRHPFTMKGFVIFLASCYVFAQTIASSRSCFKLTHESTP